MSNNNFYTPEEVRPLYSEIIPAYQEAFAVPPWNEVSKCADRQTRCESGLSAVAIGSLCSTCGLYPTQPAYEADELTSRFDTLGLSRPTAWYAEQNELGLTMAAVAWKASPSTIATEKYADASEEMSEWIADTIGAEPIMWLDEVFANRQLKSTGNLQNFGKFVTGMAAMLNCENVAYRTKEPRMVAVPKRDFGDAAVVLKRKIDLPDGRDFVMIRNVQEVDL
ncbi:hypothetical protein EON76_02790 [bacterium]|nr:MAG: hypothetical protein EON76_02790 [bacterium]